MFWSLSLFLPKTHKYYQLFTWSLAMVVATKSSLSNVINVLVDHHVSQKK